MIFVSSLIILIIYNKACCWCCFCEVAKTATLQIRWQEKTNKKKTTAIGLFIYLFVVVFYLIVTFNLSFFLSPLICIFDFIHSFIHSTRIKIHSFSFILSLSLIYLFYLTQIITYSVFHSIGEMKLN